MALLLATMAGAGYFLNKNIPDTPQQKKVQVPANQKPSGINIYDSRRYLEAQGAIEKEADNRFLKGFHAEETKVIPSNYNQIFSKQVRGTSNLARSALPSELMTDSTARGKSAADKARIQREYNSSYSVFDSESQLLGAYPEVNIRGVAGRNSSQAQKNSYITANTPTAYSGQPQIVGQTGLITGNSDLAKFGAVFPGQNPKAQASREGFSATISGPQRNVDAPFHNNMVPHFGAHVRQNVRRGHSDLLESFTGNVSESTQFRMVHKKELERDQMFAPSSGFSYPYGTPNIGGYGRERYITSELKTGVLPTEQVRVGPGLNQKDTPATPVDGFHPVFRPSQYSVDDLRIASNPKLTYRGRVIRGTEEASGRRGFTGNVYKHNPDTFFVNDPSRYFTTASADSLRPKMETKENYRESFGPTSRQETSSEYVGSAMTADAHAEKSYNSAYNRQDPRRANFLQSGPSNVSAENQASVDYDYGRSGKYNHSGSGYYASDADQSGYYASEQERATTEAEQGSYRSNVSDTTARTMPFFDLSRNTIKQTTLIGGSREKSGPSTNANQRQSMHYFDNQKVTRKQTLESSGSRREVSGPTSGSNLRPQMKLFDNAKTTKVETLAQQDTTGQAYSGQTNAQKTRLYDNAKTTKVETLPEWAREASGPSSSVNARPTTRPYVNTRARQQLPDFLREGGIGSSQNVRPMDQLAYDNAENTAAKETTLVQRRPVREGVKTWIGGDSITVQSRDKVLYSGVARNVDATDSGVVPGNKQWVEIPTKFNTGMTSIVTNKLDSESRSQPYDWLVTAHTQNPYTQPLNSVAGY